MDFDDRLHRAFDALAERLRQATVSELAAVRAELTGAAQAERDAAAAEASRQARLDSERELGDRLAAEISRAGDAARAEALAGQKAASDRLIEAVRAIDAAYSLSEILD